MNNSTYHELVLDNLKYAESIARKFYRRYHHELLDFDDLLGAAYIGLCMAAQRYQPSTGVPFRAYCHIRIRGAMFDFVRNQMFPFSRRRSESEKKREESTTSATKHERVSAMAVSSTAQRIIEELGIILHGDILSDGGTLSYLNNQSPEEHASSRSLESLMDRALALMPERERELLKLKYYSDQSFNDMAVHFNDVRSSWLCRIHTRALDRLRKVLDTYQLDEWIQEVA